MAEGTDSLALGSITITQKNASGISGSVLYSGSGITDNDGANTLDVVSVPAGSSNVSVTVAGGSNRTVSIDPALGSDLYQYNFDSIPMVDSIKVAGLLQTLTNISASHTINASFSNDLTPPTVVSKSPDNLATGVDLNSTITVAFSEAIDQTSVDETSQTGFILKDNSGNNIKWSVVKSVNSLKFTPVGALLSNKTYTATITTVIKDLATPPNSLVAPVTWSFQTVKPQYVITLNAGTNGSVTTVPTDLSAVSEGSNVVITITPTVTGAHPWYKVGSITLDNVAQAIPVQNANGSYTYTLSNVLAAHTVDIAYVKQSWDVVAAPQVNADISSVLTPLDGNGKVTVSDNDSVVLTMKPHAGYLLSTLKDNTASVSLLSSAVTKTANADGTFTWTYTLSNIIANHTVVPQFVADTTAPTVISVTPADKATGVDPAVAFDVVFSEAIAASSIDQTTQTGFTLINLSNNSTVAWTVTKAASGAECIFTPTSPLALGTQYLATLPATLKDLSPLGNTLAAAKIWTFTTRMVTHAVTVTSGANGTFSSTPAATAGVVTVNDGLNVVLTITPQKTAHPWYQLAGIKVDGVAVQLPAINADGTYTFTLSAVTAAHTVDISFATISRTVTLSPVTNGAVVASPSFDASGSMTVVDGGSVTITATPATAYYLSDLKINGVSVIAGVVNNSYTLAGITSNTGVNVTFSPYPYKIDIYQPDSSTGKIDAILPQSGNYASGNTVYFIPGYPPSFKLTPARGYLLDTVSYGGSAVVLNPASFAVDGTYTYASPNVNQSSTLTATFKLITYNVTATTDGNGSITANAPNGTLSNTYVVYYGGSALFTVTPNAGYVFKDLLLDGASVKSQVVNNTFSLSAINVAHTLNATFEKKNTVTATAGQNGSISPAGVSTVSSGGSLTYMFTPATGYQVSAVKVDGTAVATSDSYVFSNLTANHTIDVTFALKTFKVTAAADTASGSTTLSATTVTYGGSVDIVVTPATGYTVTDIKVTPAGGTEASVIGKATKTASGTYRYTLTPLQNDYAITPVFAAQSFVMTTSAGTGGTITASNAAPVYNGSVTFTITPGSGYKLLDVTVDGASVKSQLTSTGTTSTYILSSVTADHSVIATFTNITYTITASVNNTALGSISPTGTATVNSGAGKTYQITAATGAVLNSLKVDGASVTLPANGVYTFTNVIQNHTIVATFSSSATVTYPDGDINGDGKVDIADVLLALQMSIKLVTPTTTQLAHGDVGPMTSNNKPSPDGKIDIDDVVVLLQRVVGNIPVW